MKFPINDHILDKPTLIYQIMFTINVGTVNLYSTDTIENAVRAIVHDLSNQGYTKAHLRTERTPDVCAVHLLELAQRRGWTVNDAASEGGPIIHIVATDTLTREAFREIGNAIRNNENQINIYIMSSDAVAKEPRIPHEVDNYIEVTGPNVSYTKTRRQMVETKQVNLDELESARQQQHWIMDQQRRDILDTYPVRHVGLECK